jgi:hypothetical protein
MTAFDMTHCFIGRFLNQTLRSIAQAIHLVGLRRQPGLPGSPSDATGSRECAPPMSTSTRVDGRLRIVWRRRATRSIVWRWCERPPARHEDFTHQRNAIDAIGGRPY